MPNLQGRPIVSAVERGCSSDQHVAQRKLGAILWADVAAYSRLMGDDEKETLHVLQDSRALFDRFVEAVACARDVQKAIAERNQDVAEALAHACRAVEVNPASHSDCLTWGQVYLWRAIMRKP